MIVYLAIDCCCCCFKSTVVENVNSGANSGASGAGGSFAAVPPSVSDFGQLPTNQIIPHRSSLAAAAPSSSIDRQQTAPPLILESECPVTDCDFDDGSFCRYVSGDLIGEHFALPTDSSIRRWEVSRGKIANSLTGIEDDFSGSKFDLYMVI
jgi:hypothetical protein